MTISGDHLRALFPSLYSRRDPVRVGTHNSRDWSALRLPYMRLMGPNWSFSAKIAANGQGLVLQTLSESEAARRLDGEEAFHAPTYLSAQIDGIFGGGQTNYGDSYSRYSAVAVNLSRPNFASEPWQPFGPGLQHEPIQTRTTGLILAPFGHVPENEIDDKLHLPASRVVNGEIWTRPMDGYTAQLRGTLGLGAVTGAHADTLVFLPDGVALLGKITLPWDATQTPLAAWFKVTSRTESESDGQNLRLWLKPGLPEAQTAGGLIDWTRQIERFEQELLATSQHSFAPKWMTLRAARQIGLSALRWPCQVENEILMTREADGALHVVSDDLLVTLGADTDGRTGRLTVRPKRFSMSSREEDGQRFLVISGQSDAPAETQENEEEFDRTDAFYQYERDQAPLPHLPDPDVFESLDIGTPTSDDNRDLRLALPTLSNASRLREAMGFAEPPSDTTDPHLWVFTPLTNGWLHWAFPNVTLSRLEDMGGEGQSGPDTPEDFETYGIWSMRPEDSDAERAWSISLSNAKQASFRTKIALYDVGWTVRSAQADLNRLGLTMDGIVPATAFAQSEDRILPESQDRALRATGLNAITPGLLAGAERELWAKNTLKISAQIKNLRLMPREGTDTPQSGAAFGTRLDEDTRTPDLTMQWVRPETDPAPVPWAWLRHDNLPTFQTMPLATTGPADRQPSSLRELAPLVLNKSAKTLLFADAFDMSVPGPRLATGSAQGTHPLSSVGNEVEFGQAVTSLPSVTLYPGFEDNGTDGWAGISSSVTARYRHDIALTDEFYTLAKLPPKPPSDDEEATLEKEDDQAEAAPLAFTPLPYNAPGDVNRSAWAEIWTGHARALALCAPEAQDLQSDGKIADYFYGVKWDGNLSYSADITRAEVDGESNAYEPGSSRPELESIGSVTLKLGDLAPSEMPGLPATADLMGLSYQQGDQFRLTRGALDAYGNDTSFGQAGYAHFDQAGYAHAPAEATSNLISRKVRKVTPTLPSMDAVPDQSSTLVSLAQPLKLCTPVLGTIAPVFHFRDVNFDDDTAHLIEAYSDSQDTPAGKDKASLAARPDKALDHGFTWSLTQLTEQDEIQRGIALGVFLFDPVALLKVTKENGAFKSAELVGQIGLPGDRDEEFLASSGRAILTVTAGLTIDDQLSWTLAIENLSLPLRDEDDVIGGAPYLMAKKLTLSCDSTGLSAYNVEQTELRFRLGGRIGEKSTLARGRSLTVPLTQVEASDANLFFKTPSGLPWRPLAAVNLPVLPDTIGLGISAEYRLQMTLKTGDVELDVDKSLGLMNEEVLSNSDICSISGAKFDVTTEVDINAQSIGVTWTSSGADTRVLGAPITSGEGAVFGALTWSPGKVEPAGNLSQAFHLQIGGELSLQFESAPSQNSEENKFARLSGVFEADNLFSWPKLALDQTQSPLTAEPQQGRILHGATVSFDRARVAMKDISSGQVRLLAKVGHTLRFLSEPDGQNTDTWHRWTCFQRVSLWDPAKLKKELEQAAQQTDTYSLAPLIQISDPRKYLVPSAQAGHWGLTTQDMQALAQSLDVHGADYGLVADISAHHLLNASDTGSADRRMRLVSVPGFLSKLDPDGLLDRIAEGKTFSRPKDDARLDGLPEFSATTRTRLRARLGQAAAEARRTRTGLADHLSEDNPDKRHRPLFQSATRVTVTADNTAQEEDRFWAETAFWLSHLYDLPDRRVEPQEAYGFVTSGWVSESLLDDSITNRGHDRKIPLYTAAAHAASWSDERLAQMHTLLLPPPPISQAPTDEWHLRLQTLSADESRVETIAQLTVDQNRFSSDTDQKVPQQILKWGETTLARSAPGLSSALLTVAEGASPSQAWPKHMRIVASQTPEMQSIVEPLSLTNNAGAPQPQRSTSPPLIEDGAAMSTKDGFTALGVHSATLTDTEGALPESGQTNLKLTASGASFGVARPAGTRRHQSDPLWVTNRETLAFRSYKDSAAQNGSNTRITQALPPATNAALPAAFLSSRAGDVIAPDASALASNSIIPAFLLQTVVAPRSGAFLAQRTGIDSPTTAKAARRSVSEVPQWIRAPRPVELGTNDRPVASAFEPFAFNPTKSPEAMLFGGAAARDVLSPAKDALTRDPRAKFAYRLKLSAPEQGLMPADWDGAIKVDVAEVFGDIGETAPAWTVQEAALDLNGRVFVADLTGTPKIKPGDPIVFSDFRPRENSDAAPTESIRELAALPSGTRLKLTLLLENSGLTRQVAFWLWRAGGRLIEQTAYIRFEDPAYNDILTGQPKLQREDLEGGKDEILLLAESPEVRPDAFVEMGVALAAKGQGTDPEATFMDGTSDNIILNQNGAQHELSVSYELQRPGTQKSVPLVQSGGGGLKRSGNYFLGLPLRLALMTAENIPFSLQDKDRLKITINIGQDGPPLNLVLDIADRPLLPPNPAIYHLLSLHEEQDKPDRVHAPMQVTSPDPFLVQLVDPKDMVNGIVRRRALFQWNGFSSREKGLKRFALQKEASTGAAWLGDDMKLHWREIED